MKHLLSILLLTFLPIIAHAEDPSSTPQQDSPIITAPLPEEHLIDNKIYFFAHSMCLRCKDPFIFFATEHPELNIPITDMKFQHNMALYKECVQKFNIPHSELRLPLICMGNNYIMSWDEDSPRLFNEYLQTFMKDYPQP